MAKLESENNSIILECVKQDEDEMEFIVKVKSHSIVTNYSLIVGKNDFKTFIAQLMQINDTHCGAAELRERFEEKKIYIETDGIARVTDGVGVIRLIISGCHCDYKNKGNDCRFRFVADDTTLVPFLWGLSEFNCEP
jgi:hypothetical protein